MKKKIFIQIFLLILILIIFFIVYQTYFKKISDLDAPEIKLENTNQENKLKNITYDSIDREGIKYIISADTGIFKEEEPDIIYMTKVTAKIILLDGSTIYIESLNAKYNNLNFDTKFKNNVKLKFLEKTET